MVAFIYVARLLLAQAGPEQCATSTIFETRTRQPRYFYFSHLHLSPSRTFRLPVSSRQFCCQVEGSRGIVGSRLTARRQQPTAVGGSVGWNSSSKARLLLIFLCLKYSHQASGLTSAFTFSLAYLVPSRRILISRYTFYSRYLSTSRPSTAGHTRA